MIEELTLSKAQRMLEEIRKDLPDPEKSKFTEQDYLELLDYVEDLLWESGLEW